MTGAKHRKRKAVEQSVPHKYLTDSIGSNDSSVSRIRRNGTKLLRMLSGRKSKSNWLDFNFLPHESKLTVKGPSNLPACLTPLIDSQRMSIDNPSAELSTSEFRIEIGDSQDLSHSLHDGRTKILATAATYPPPTSSLSHRQKADIVMTQFLKLQPQTSTQVHLFNQDTENLDMSHETFLPGSVQHRRAQSSPGSIPLAQKLSAVFFAPTVIRRYKNFSPTTQTQCHPDVQVKDPYQFQPTLPCAPPPGLVSVYQRTTTLPGSYGDSLSHVFYEQSTVLYFYHPSYVVRGETKGHYQSQANGEAKEGVIASVALMERVVAAKVFFETHYKGPQYQRLSPRSLRRQKMESGLHTTHKTPYEQREVRRHFAEAESAHLRQQRVFKRRKMSKTKTFARGVSIGGYEMVRLLGRGSFGVVSLVRDRSEKGLRHNQRSTSAAIYGAVYAMKIIQKSKMLQSCQEGHLRAERDFLVSCAETSRWVVPLVASFQDVDNLYLVMEFEIGGDFLGLLLSNRVLPESWTRWYVAEMILCVEEAHRMNWIHRDVKPDNFLISASGHLKISDFGLAFDGHWAHTQAYYTNHRYSLLEKLGIHVEGDQEDREKTARAGKRLHLPTIRGSQGVTNSPSYMNNACFTRRKLAESVVGTSQYMAPEVVRGEWYDGRCDWWSIGIILYECLYGTTPFLRKDRQLTKMAICDHVSVFTWPSESQCSTPQVRDLIRCLLSEKESRLCSWKYLKNDFKRDIRGAPVRTRESEKSSKYFRGQCAYEDDAENIKEHPFFSGIPWEVLHLTQPPLIPDVKRGDETKYFDSEKQILADFSSEPGTGWAMANDERRPKDVAADLDGVGFPQPEQKISRRPRDKLLRDATVAKTVLAARKKGAFLGYTYRRPQTWNMGEIMEREYAQMDYGYGGFDSDIPNGGYERLV